MNKINENYQANLSTQAFTEVKSFLDERNLSYEQVEDKLVYRIKYPAKFMPLTCFAQVTPEWGHFLFYVLIPIKVAESLRLVIAEYLTRLDFGQMANASSCKMSINQGERAVLTPISGQFAQIQRHLVLLAIVWGNPGELFGGWGHYGLRSNCRIILPRSCCIQKKLC